MYMATSINPTDDPGVPQPDESAAETARLQRSIPAPDESAAETARLMRSAPPTVTDEPTSAEEEEEDDDTVPPAILLDPEPSGSSRGLQTARLRARASARALEAETANQQLNDWRVMLKLAENANYLYKSPNNRGILAPLFDTDGVVFPYTPTVSVQYAATYDASDITHSNYKINQYKGSSVDSINITGIFTAQDTYEANYLLAVIHFFKSVTKMFYGNDTLPRNGTPPPLCYMTGFGSFQFNEHPLAITSFTYNLPDDVDYIRATSEISVVQSARPSYSSSSDASAARMTDINAGAEPPPANFVYRGGAVEPTYVPTKIQMSINAVPIIARNSISQVFSLNDYASGKLMLGKNSNIKGIW